MAHDKARIGIIGYGYIGSYVYEQITSRPELGLDIAFVYNRSKDKVAALPADLVLDDLADFASKPADLIIELAHPAISRDWGTTFLQHTDYMPLSLTALADANLETALLQTAATNGHCLYIPHGAIVGLEALNEGKNTWEEVKMVMKKPVRSLDFSNVDIDPQSIDSATTIYDGPARGICPLYPRNVNSHAAVALGGLGFDRTHSVLVADPALEVSIIEIEARGQGVEIQIQRSNPMKGVTGVFTLVSTLASICRAKAPGTGVQIC